MSGSNGHYFFLASQKPLCTTPANQIKPFTTLQQQAKAQSRANAYLPGMLGFLKLQLVADAKITQTVLQQ